MVAPNNPATFHGPRPLNDGGGRPAPGTTALCLVAIVAVPYVLGAWLGTAVGVGVLAFRAVTG